MINFSHPGWRSSLLALSTCLAASAGVFAASFTPGNLAVLRVGDGVQTLANTGNTIFMDEYTPAGVLVQSFQIPDSLPNGLFASGSATSEGALMRSPNGRWLTFVGYNTNRPTAASVSGIASTVVPRGIGTLDASGTYTLAATTASQFSGNNIRSGASDGTNNFWAAGGNSGTYYFGFAASAVAAQATVVNSRVLNIINGGLYFSVGATTARGVYNFNPSGLPTAATPTNFVINTGATSSTYGFAINPAGTIAYVADDSSPAGGGGILRYTNSGTAWLLDYNVNTNASRGLVVDWSDANPVIYATTATSTTTNFLITLTDTGAASASTLLAYSPANTAFRGVAFSPLAMPTITDQPMGTIVECQGSAMFSVTATGPAPLSYQWRRNGTDIDGAMGSTVTVNPATLASAGNYTVVVANSVGSVTSSVAVLTVTDTVAPVLSLPANITVTRLGSAGAVVNYAASASDACEGIVAINCTPVSGSTFAPGATTVTCKANDSSGNTNTGSFTVTVTESVTPHLDTIADDVTNVLGSTVFINHGLVGVGHISASALDSFGETFGSMSGMQITGFATNGDGSYSGTLNVLPDRGYNSGAFYADYAARINQVGFTFRPYYGPTNIGGTTDLEKLNAQTNQFTFGAISGVRFTYFDPNTGSNSFTTGLDPGTNYITLFGKTMPYVKSYTGVQSPSSTITNTYTGINKLPLDSEALILKPDGSGYVGDEYGEHIYYFNPLKQIIGAIVPPQAMLPHSPTNVPNYSSTITPLNGRRNNQGFEGVSLSPDGTRLFALQQSASLQDSDAANNQRAKNTRLLIYDVGSSPTPASPLSAYALTLPIYKLNGNGAAADRTCAQSEIVALDNTRFLVLSRDGNGLGNAVTNPNVYKAILLVDTTVGTPVDFAGDAARNAESGKITTSSGVLDPSITALSWVEAVNLLNTNQLAKFNVTWDSGSNQVTKLTMGEKWEGMALVSANDPLNPNDYFLFVGNDNDFVTGAGQMRGPDGTLVSYNAFDGYPASRIPAPLDSANSENDTRLLAYRVTITPGTAPVAPLQQTVIAVTNRIYSPYRTDLTAGAYVYVDSDIMAGSVVRATQRALGYREVDYKSQVPGTLFFNQATPTTNGNTITYDYSTQNAKTNQVGFWVDKDVPILIGPDGNAYITDGHHTTAGYLSSNAPVRQIVPGLNRVILGHIVANFYNPLNPQAPDDTWWTARAAENNAYLYGTNGNALTQPGEPDYASLQPILPGVQPMPNTPSAVGAGAMLNSAERSLSWGLADGILKSAFDRAGAKIAGYKKSAPGSSVDINFVEFYWADFLRNRIVWDNNATGSPFGSPNGDASVTAAPLGFFAAVANGIALAKSEVYRDQYGRLLREYTNSALFAPNTVNWANGSYSNGLAAPSNTFNLFLLDDSTLVGDITPSAVSTNILRINSNAGMTVTNTILNITKLFINGGTRIATTWKDATVTNTTLTFPGGTGDVTLTGTAFVSESTTLSNGAFIVSGALTGGGSLNVWGGSLRGNGTINGSVVVGPNGLLAPGTSIGTLTVNGPLTLSGATTMEINKSGATLTSDHITGVTALTYGGTLTVVASGDALAEGDTFQLFSATGYSGAFALEDLPNLGAGLNWNTSRLGLDGTLSVVVPPSITTQPMNATVECQGTTNFSVTAAGSAPLAYQWRRNGTDIGGATASSLTISPATVGKAGDYTVVVANSGGSITSSVAVLTVLDNTAPTIGTPGNITVSRTSSGGATVVFQASATDACAGSVAVVCTPASGSTFGIGATTVTCVANDGNGNTNTGSFTVTVQETVTPHLDTIADDVTNVLGSTVFINHGLVGVGHISASALDSFGETFGSMSGMQITGFATSADGSYSGTLNVLPDRGYNLGAFYADYAARINQVGFTFRPYYGPTNIGGTTDLEKLNAQTNQFTFGAISGVRFTYFDPNTGSNSFTTGLDPGTNYITLFGKTMPYVKSYTGVQSPSSTITNTYTGINKLPLDSEALILKPDGSGYVGDEYGEHIYYFNTVKQIIGAIVPPQAMLPHSPTNVPNYSSTITPLNGRRNNQGFEGVSLSPDGTRLFALQQSASLQDSDAANNQRAKNTRLLIYDVGSSPTPASPLSAYALTLPIYKLNGNGAAADRTCAQSEIVALDNTRFLVLSRDGNGLGNAVTNPNVYKAILLVDTTVGTPVDFAGDAARNAESGKITTSSGVLDPSITALSWVEAVNLLNTNQLAKFNVTWDSGSNQVTKLTMGEKWEGMALVSANDPLNPNDYFLFVGNDNDFVTGAGQMRGPDGTLVSYNAFDGYPASRIPAPLDSANSENDTRLLAYRVTITPGTAPVAPLQQTVIAVTNRIYSPYRTDLTAGAYVYVDSDIMAGSVVRATQRALGYREVDYKSQVPGTLFFNQATPTTNGNTITYDYSTQNAKTNQVGFWVDKDVPILIGPDGNAYITDGHHTTAGYLSSNAPVRQIVPGLNRVILGHIVANFYNPLNPQAPDDTWWTARAAENNAYLYGTNGNALTQPGEPDYASLQPILPGVQPMPNTPSAVGAGAMLNSAERSLSWGLADGILKSAFDRAGAKIAGYKKSAPGSSVDINFVEFYWADFLRNRIVWDNNATGSPFGSPNGDASVTAAPLGFFAAVANGIALAKSEVYRDQYGRLLRGSTNSALFAPNTVNWANGSYSNGLAAPSNTFNLFLLDDSTLVGDITPSAVSTNILRINSNAGMTVTNTILNITKLFINGGTRIATTWKDATVTNTTLTFPGGTGDVTLTGTAFVSESTTLSNGAFIVSGALTGGGSLNVWGGSLRGNGTINGSVVVGPNGLLAPGTSIGTLTVNGPLTLSGATTMEINKSGATLTSDHITGVTALTYGGTLTVVASGDSLAAGDSFQLFVASSYSASFTTLNLPAVPSELEWDATRLAIDGVIMVRFQNRAPVAHSHGAATEQDHELSLPFAKLLSDATDADGDLLAVSAVSATSTNGGSVALGATAVTYTPLPGFTGEDRFDFTVSDGHGGTASAVVVVLVVSGNLPGQNMVSLTPSGSGYLLRFAGIPGYAYEIQRTTTLMPASWATLDTVTAPIHGIIDFVDTNPPQPSAFYRTKGP